MDGMHEALIRLGTEHLQSIDGYEPAYDVIYYNYWSGHEESGWMAIMFMDGEYYRMGGGYSVMSNDNEDRWFIWPITEQEAFDEMNEYEAAIDEFDLSDG